MWHRGFDAGFASGATRRTLRTMLTKPGWSSMEIRTMRGVLSALDGKKRPRN